MREAGDDVGVELHALAGLGLSASFVRFDLPELRALSCCTTRVFLGRNCAEAPLWFLV